MTYLGTLDWYIVYDVSFGILKCGNNGQYYIYHCMCFYNVPKIVVFVIDGQRRMFLDNAISFYS